MKRTKLILKKIQEKNDLQKSKNDAMNANKKRIDDMIFNLSEDIKEYQHLSKVLGHHNKTVESLSKRIISKLSENNHEIIQVILTKKKRSSDELNIIKTFLSTMKYLSSMIKIIDTDKILCSLSIFLKMEKKVKDSVLFRYGNKGTKFYILLSGQVTILILKETFVKLCFMKFFMHLIMLKILGEEEAVKKIIIANYKNRYHLDQITFESIFEKVAIAGDKIIAKKKKNKEESEDEESEEEESNEDSYKVEKEKKADHNEKQNESSQEMIIDINKRNIKKRSTLQLNYLVSNFNGFLSSNHYQYVKEDSFNKEDITTNNKIPLPSLKRLSIYHNNLKPLRTTIFKGNSLNINIPFFHNDEEIQELVQYYVFLKENIKNHKKMKFSVKEYINDTYIDSKYSKELNDFDHNETDNYIIYKYFEITKKSNGDTFGELALQHEDCKRTATIITNTDCILGYLSKVSYEACLSEIEIKRRKNEINFIMSFAIFDQMNWTNFENKYFNYFKREYYSQNDTIIKQGEKIDKIFFIMDGQFEMSTSLSLGAMYRLIRQKKGEKLRVKFSKNINKIRLTICNNKDIIGLNDCCLTLLNGKKVSFVNVTSISLKSIVFTLDLHILNELKAKIPELNKNLKNIINIRENAMIDRLTSIFNTLITMKEVNNKERLEALNLKNKSRNKENMPDELKIKEIIENNKNEINKEENFSIVQNKLSPLTYKSKRPLSKINYKQKFFDEVIATNFPKVKGNFSTKNTNKIRKYIKSNYNNRQLKLKSPFFTLNELKNKDNIKIHSSPVNKIIYKEYNNLFNWVDNIKNKSEKQKKFKENEQTESLPINNDVDNNINQDIKKDNKEEKSKEVNILTIKENSKIAIDNDGSLSFINKKKNLIKNKIFKMNNAIKENETSVNQNNNKLSFQTIKENSKIDNEKSTISPTIKLPKTKTISNESYLKQILGTRYKEDDDEFISYAEKKFMKTIKDYNNNMIKLEKMRLKFKKKNKEKYKK